MESENERQGGERNDVDSEKRDGEEGDSENRGEKRGRKQ